MILPIQFEQSEVSLNLWFLSLLETARFPTRHVAVGAANMGI